MSRPTNTQFAVAAHVLLLLADDPDRPRSSEDMAPSVQASPVYLRRVLGHLRRAGLVVSRPGAGGGWLLTRAPGEITLGDAWRAVQGDDPVLGRHGPAEACPVGREVGVLFAGLEDRVSRAIEDELDRTTLAQAAARLGAPPVAAA